MVGPMPFPWKRHDRSRIFYVECQCGAEFQVTYEPAAALHAGPDRFLVELSGACPSCGLRLEEIEPLGEVPTPPPSAGQSRA